MISQFFGLFHVFLWVRPTVDSHWSSVIKEGGPELEEFKSWGGGGGWRETQSPLRKEMEKSTHEEQNNVAHYYLDVKSPGLGIHPNDTSIKIKCLE